MAQAAGSMKVSQDSSEVIVVEDRSAQLSAPQPTQGLSDMATSSKPTDLGSGKDRPKDAPKVSQEDRKKQAEAKALERELKRAKKEEEIRKKEEEKEKLKQQKELERQQKELERQQKELEKQQKELEKQQKRAEKESKKAEKEAEKFKSKAEKEAEKSCRKALETAKQSGFGDIKVMNRSKNLMMTFLKKNPKGNGEQKPAAEKSSQQSDSSDSVQEEPLEAKRAELDRYLSCQLSPRSVKHEFVGICNGWRSQRHSFAQPKGVPPSWSRKPHCCTDLQALAAQYYGENVDLATVTLWRRKLLQFADSQRPAYYGSFSKKSSHVSGRKPFSKEPTLDYEVMSDEEWEDEGDGESLASQDDDEEREKGEEEEEEDGFVVEDGHLSEDEGIVVEENDDGGDVDDPAGLLSAPTAAGGVRRSDPQLQLLEGALERARKSNRPLILCSLPSIQYEPTTTLDPSILSSLSGTWLAPNIVIKPPRAASAALESKPSLDGQQTKEAQPGGEPRSGPGRARSEFPQQMLGELLEFLGTTSLIAIDKVVTAFVSMHPDKGLSKKGVKLKLKEVATYSSRQHKWVIKQTLTGEKRTPPKRPKPSTSGSNPDDPTAAKRIKLSPAINSIPTPATACQPSTVPVAVAIPPIQRFFKSLPSQPPPNHTKLTPNANPSSHPTNPSIHPTPPSSHPTPPSSHPTPPSSHPTPPSSHPTNPSGHPTSGSTDAGANLKTKPSTNHAQVTPTSDSQKAPLRNGLQLQPPETVLVNSVLINAADSGKHHPVSIAKTAQAAGLHTGMHTSVMHKPVHKSVGLTTVELANAKEMGSAVTGMETTTPHNLHPVPAQPCYTPSGDQNVEPPSDMRTVATGAVPDSVGQDLCKEGCLVSGNGPRCSLVPESLATTRLAEDIVMSEAEPAAVLGAAQQAGGVTGQKQTGEKQAGQGLRKLEPTGKLGALRNLGAFSKLGQVGKLAPNGNLWAHGKSGPMGKAGKAAGGCSSLPRPSADDCTGAAKRMDSSGEAEDDVIILD